MPPGRYCLARLTEWETTKFKIGPDGQRASFAIACKNMAKDGTSLCEICRGRPKKSKYQSLMMHGLVTEPIPEGSKIYGSPYYWETVAEYGDPEEECKRGAVMAQFELERTAFRRGVRPWRVQRPSDEELENMKKEKQKVEVNKKSTLMASGFMLIKKMYEESEKEPEKLPLDTIDITRIQLDCKDVWWVHETNMVFSIDESGQPDEFLGFKVGDRLKPAS
jgi:hypothetical protein